MNGNDAMIFRSREDYMDWDKLIQHCDTIDDLTAFEKEKVKRGFQILKEELGNDFLVNAFNNGHPICGNITNYAPWSRKWIAWFGEALKKLTNANNYLSMINRLKDKDKFGEGLSVLEVADKFGNFGFEIEFDPLIEINGETKKPDLKLFDTESDESIFIEVSIQKISYKEKDAWQTTQRILYPIIQTRPFLLHCGRIYKSLSEKHLEEVGLQVDELINKVVNDNAFNELIIEDVLEIAITSDNDKEMLEKWAIDRDMKIGELSGPYYNLDEVSRTKMKIDNEQRQLPNDKINIIVIKNNNLFLYKKNIHNIINELEEELYRHPNISFTVITGGHIGSTGNDSYVKSPHIYIKKATVDAHVDEYIILFNKFCEYSIPPSLYSKILNAFVQN